MDNEIREQEFEVKEEKNETPCILEEINIEELAVDGICGIY
jgi:mycofactocin precursor